MTLNSYSGLIAALNAYLDGSPIAGQEDTFVGLCEAEINASLTRGLEAGRKVRPMMARSTITIDDEFVDAPTDRGTLAFPISLIVTGLRAPWEITYISPESLADMKIGEVRAQYRVDAIVGAKAPLHYTLIGDQFQFFPAPGQPYTAEFTRYVRVPALTADAPSNWLLAAHPNVYLYGCLAQAELFGWNDGRISNLAALFTNALDGVLSAYPAPVNQAQLHVAFPAGHRPCG